MRIKFFGVVIAAALLFGLLPAYTPSAQAVETWDGKAATYFEGGTGTKENPYQIATPEQLLLFAGVINKYTYDGTDKYFGNGNRKVTKEQGAQTHTYLKTAHYKLTADISLNDTSNWESWETTPPANSWKPIGTENDQFNGTFDGDGCTISGLNLMMLAMTLGEEAQAESMSAFLGAQ